jgi:hypothetical protein
MTSNDLTSRPRHGAAGDPQTVSPMACEPSEAPGRLVDYLRGAGWVLLVPGVTVGAYLAGHACRLLVSR